MQLKGFLGPLLMFLTLFWGVKSRQMTNRPVASTRWSDTSTVISKRATSGPVTPRQTEEEQQRFHASGYSQNRGELWALCCRYLTCSAETTAWCAPLEALRDVLLLGGLGHRGSVSQGNYLRRWRFVINRWLLALTWHLYLCQNVNQSGTVRQRMCCVHCAKVVVVVVVCDKKCILEIVVKIALKSVYIYGNVNIIKQIKK